MSRAAVNRICAALPGAEVSDPWGGGHDCWKVCGKMFAVTGSVSPGVSVKTDSIDTAEMLIALGIAKRAAYLHKSWVSLPLDTPPDDLTHRIHASYRLIRDALPKKSRTGLAPF